MVSATFRFYGALNDFLPRGRRGRDVVTPCARAATTKHMIEALGVPHTEVELALVNGESAGLDALLEEDDRVAVYPRFVAIDVGPLVRVRGRPAGRMRFVADAHLGGLARLLRMAGFDTIYRSTGGAGARGPGDRAMDDGALDVLAQEEARIVLTRDRELLKRRGVDMGAFVRALRPEAQLREVVARFDLAERARPFTLCLHCNAPLRRVSRDEVADRLPPAVRAARTGFSACSTCGRLYWKGSHWRRMASMLESVLDPVPAGEGMADD